MNNIRLRKATADAYTTWLQNPEWDAIEASYLLGGFIPDQDCPEAEKTLNQASEVTFDLHEQIATAIADGKLQFKNSPSVWVAWSKANRPEQPAGLLVAFEYLIQNRMIVRSVPTKKSALPAGVSTKDAITLFGLNNAWHVRLSHLRKKDAGALMRRGARRTGKEPAKSHLWNPVLLGEILITEHVKTRKQVGTLIERKLPAWLDEWEDNLNVTDDEDIHSL